MFRAGRNGVMFITTQSIEGYKRLVNSGTVQLLLDTGRLFKVTDGPKASEMFYRCGNLLC